MQHPNLFTETFLGLEKQAEKGLQLLHWGVVANEYVYSSDSIHMAFSRT